MSRNAISIRAGSTLSLNCQKKDSAGAAESISTVTVSATLDEFPSGKPILAPAVTVTNAGTGSFTLTVTAAQTAAIGSAACTITIKYAYASGAVDVLNPFSVEIRK